MNSKIKSASIVLTGGVLLGWGSSAALAANIVGVGMYGEPGSSSMSADTSSDAVSYDENGYVTITYGNSDGLTLYGGGANDGELIAVNVDTPGSGYLTGEVATQDVDNTGNTGVGAQWSYVLDGTIGAYLEGYVTVDLNAAGNEMYGTGYIPDNGGGAQATQFTAGLNFRDDAGTAGPVCTTTVPLSGWKDIWTGAFNVGITADTGCTAWGGATAAGSGDICSISHSSGIGYGAVGGTMDFYVNGVLSTDYLGTYTVNGDGGIDVITMTANAAPAEDYPTNWDQVDMMPRDAMGTGFDHTVFMWGEYAGQTNWTPGVLCTEVTLTSHALEDVLMNNCTDCTLQDYAVDVDSGEGCSITAGPVSTGRVMNATVAANGFNYDSAPEIGIAAAGITAGTGATFSSVIGASDHYLTLEDGSLLEFYYDDDVSLYCGADYNNDNHADIVAHGTIDGYGDTICILLGDAGVIEEVVDLGESGTDWHIAGQVSRSGAEFADGHCLLWRNNTTGANAVWVCNGDGVYEKSLIEAAAAEEWFCYCTNESMGGGSRAYWYSHYGDNALWELDIDTDHSDWVPEGGMSYLRNDEGEQVNTGTGDGWEMEAVGCLSGDPGDNNLSRDIVWSNAGTGAVCIWLMDQDVSWSIDSRDYCTVGGHVYDGASGYGVADGYRCIGVGQYEVSTNYADPTGPLLNPGTRVQTFGTLWWNHNGSSYSWRMDRTIDLEAWTAAGNSGGTGLPAHPETVSAYERH